MTKERMRIGELADPLKVVITNRPLPGNSRRGVLVKHSQPRRGRGSSLRSDPEGAREEKSNKVECRTERERPE